MTDRTNTHSIIPHLVVDNAAEALAFYREALGASEDFRFPAEDGRRLMHAEMRIHGARVYLRDDFPEFCPAGEGKPMTPTALGGSPVALHLEVDNCDAWVERAVAAGCTVTMPPEDMFWGARYAQVVDPYGHAWSFAQLIPGQQFVVERTFAATPERLYRAFTERDQLLVWWGPAGFTVTHCSIDLRPDGLMHYGLRAGDGTNMWGRWVFVHIAPPERLEFIVSFSDDNAGGPTRHPWQPDWPLQTMTVVHFTEVAEGTRVTVSWSPWHATPNERKTFADNHASMREGWQGTFERLARHLEEG